MSMLPSVSEDVLQDTNNVRKTVVLPKKTAVFLFVLLLLTIALGLYKFSPKSPSRNEETAATTAESTPLEPTNTFVDSLFGTIVFFRDQSVYEYQLPTRSMHQLIGVKQEKEKEEEVESFIQTRPVWSRDGKYLALIGDSSHVVLSEYETGKLVGSFPLHEKVSEAIQTTLSIDSASQVLAVGFSHALGVTGESLQFFSIEAKKELGVYPRCEAKGIWITGVGFVTKCALGDVESIVLIRFQPDSTTMVPLTKETTSTKYTLIDEYDQGTVIAIRKQNEKQDLVTISPTGKIQALASKNYPKGVELSSLVDIYASLATRIEKATGLSGVKNVSVATTNNWMVFETKDGIYVAQMSLAEKPYFIGKGTLPSVRPY